MILAISLALTLLPVAGIVFLATREDLFSVGGVFMTLMLLAMAAPFALATVQHLRRTRAATSAGAEKQKAAGA